MSPALKCSPGTERRHSCSSACVRADIKRPEILGMRLNRGWEGIIWKDKDFRMKNASPKCLRFPSRSVSCFSFSYFCPCAGISAQETACSFSAQRTILGLLIGAHPLAAAGSVAKNWAHIISRCYPHLHPLHLFVCPGWEPRRASTLPFSTLATQCWVVSQSACPNSHSRSPHRLQGHKSMRLFPPRSS